MIGGTSRLHPPFGLDFEADEAIDTNSHLSGSIVSTKGFRQGGPKEARLRRIALLSKQKETEHMYPVKAENLPHTASSEALLNTFKTFGEVGDVYIPVDLKSRKPKKDFAVIRFTDKKAAEDVLQLSESSPDKLTQSLGLVAAAAAATGGQIRLSPLKKQPSFFTNNTGRLGIANEPVITGVDPEAPRRRELFKQSISLESCRARNGYPWGSCRELKYLPPRLSGDLLELHSIKLIHLSRDINEQQLHDAFQSYGVIADVTCPQPLMVSEQTSDSNIGHAFIRYKDRRDMAAAMSDVMDGKVLINGHTIEGEVVPPSYWPSERTRRYY